MSRSLKLKEEGIKYLQSKYPKHAKEIAKAFENREGDFYLLEGPADMTEIIHAGICGTRWYQLAVISPECFREGPWQEPINKNSVKKVITLIEGMNRCSNNTR